MTPERRLQAAERSLQAAECRAAHRLDATVSSVVDKLVDAVDELHTKAAYRIWKWDELLSRREAIRDGLFAYLEYSLSHDQYEAIEDREKYWMALNCLLSRHPSLRTVLTIPDEFTGPRYFGEDELNELVRRADELPELMSFIDPLGDGHAIDELTEAHAIAEEEINEEVVVAAEFERVREDVHDWLFEQELESDGDNGTDSDSDSVSSVDRAMADTDSEWETYHSKCKSISEAASELAALPSWAQIVGSLPPLQMHPIGFARLPDCTCDARLLENCYAGYHECCSPCKARAKKLKQAVTAGTPEEVSELLRHGYRCTASAETMEHNSILGYALVEREGEERMAIVRSLLEARTSAHTCNANGETSLLLACSLDDADGSASQLVALLLRRGAMCSLSQLNNSFRWATALRTAVAKGSLSVVKCLLEASANPTDEDPNGSDYDFGFGYSNTTAPLTIAAERGHMSMVILLSLYGARRGLNEEEAAEAGGHWDMVHWLQHTQDVRNPLQYLASRLPLLTPQMVAGLFRNVSRFYGYPPPPMRLGKRRWTPGDDRVKQFRRGDLEWLLLEPLPSGLDDNSMIWDSTVLVVDDPECATPLEVAAAMAKQGRAPPGSAARLVLDGSRAFSCGPKVQSRRIVHSSYDPAGWSPQVHALYEDPIRRRVVRLLLFGHQLARRYGDALIGLWMGVILPAAARGPPDDEAKRVLGRFVDTARAQIGLWYQPKQVVTISANRVAKAQITAEMRVSIKEAFEAAKHQGNQAFRAKNFNLALRHYIAAHQADPHNTTGMLHTVLSNVSAVYALTGKWRKSFQFAFDAVQLKKDFAKGHARMGTALLALYKFSEARQSFLASLQFEPGNAQVLKQLKQMEIKQIKLQLARVKQPGGGGDGGEAKRMAVTPPINDPVAKNARRVELQEAGNAHFRANERKRALACYSEAILMCESEPKIAVPIELYSNRSNVLCMLNRFEEALADADLTVAINPEWARGHSRRGNALHAMCRSGIGRWAEARDAYSKALELDPGNETVQRAAEQLRTLRGAAGWTW